MTSRIGSLIFKNPVIAASGTFGFGQEYRHVYDPACLGGISGKGITLYPRAGNQGQRIAETPGGLMNSIGLENPGLEDFLEHEWPRMSAIDTALLLNLGGSTVDEYRQAAVRVEAFNRQADLLGYRPVEGIELNISCPNVKEGGLAFGTVCESARQVVRAVRQSYQGTLIVKLSPAAQDLVTMAQVCQEEGADGLSLINTLPGLLIDVSKRRAVFDHVYAGLSGPCLKPVALRMVREVCRAVRIPVIGMGGIVNAQDALAFIMAGAQCVQFGSVSFMNPSAGQQIVEGIERYLQEERLTGLETIRGIL